MCKALSTCHLLNILAVCLIWISIYPVSAFAQAGEAVNKNLPKLVSVSLCTDQILLQLARPEQILSLSHLARDSRSSLYSEAAHRFAYNNGDAEEIYALQPDLVLASSFGHIHSLALLEARGITVLRVPPSSSVQDIIENLQAIGLAVNAKQQTEKLIDQMQAVIRSSKAIVSEPATRISAIETLKLFIHYDVNGYVHGKQTLLHDFARQAGFRSIGDITDIDGYQAISLENLVELDADLVSLGDQWEDPPAFASLSLTHPALRKWMRNKKRIRLDPRLWQCGLPQSLQLIEQLHLEDAPANH